MFSCPLISCVIYIHFFYCQKFRSCHSSHVKKLLSFIIIHHSSLSLHHSSLSIIIHRPCFCLCKSSAWVDGWIDQAYVTSWNLKNLKTIIIKYLLNTSKDSSSTPIYSSHIIFLIYLPPKISVPHGISYQNITVNILSIISKTLHLLGLNTHYTVPWTLEGWKRG